MSYFTLNEQGAHPGSLMALPFNSDCRRHLRLAAPGVSGTSREAHTALRSAGGRHRHSRPRAGDRSAERARPGRRSADPDGCLVHAFESSRSAHLPNVRICEPDAFRPTRDCEDREGWCPFYPPPRGRERYTEATSRPHHSQRESDDRSRVHRIAGDVEISGAVREFRKSPYGGRSS